MSQLLARYTSLPRSMKWLLVAGAFVLAYFLVIERAIDATRRMNVEADKIASALSQKAQTRSRVAEAAGQIEQLTGLLGQPLLPSDAAERDSALHRRINTIFGEHRVQSQKAVYKDPVPLPGDPPHSLIGAKQRLEKLAVDLTFETDIPTLMAIMEALEKAPEVCAVSKVTVRKLAPPAKSRDRDGGPVQVNLTAEAWAIGTITTNSSRPTAKPNKEGDL